MTSSDEFVMNHFVMEDKVSVPPNNNFEIQTWLSCADEIFDL
jgi:hypothetical protein